MAYCKRCGAYIPDGLSACLACGYDEAGESAVNNGAAAAAAARDQQNEDFRLKYEEERRKRQEENLRWAEEERRRRDEEERRRLEEERMRLEEERKRLEQERILNENQARGRQRYADPRQSVSRNQSNEKGRGRVLGALSYLSVLWILPFIFCRDDYAARYHARQGLTLFIFGVICDAVGSLTGFGWILSLFRLYCIYKGMSNALNDRTEPLPLIGEIGDKLG